MVNIILRKHTQLHMHIWLQFILIYYVRSIVIENFNIWFTREVVKLHSKPFAELIGGIHINADEVRTKYNDWDFTQEGRMRQAQRMRHLADGVVMAGKMQLLKPTENARLEFATDYTVWMDTIKEGKYEDTNRMFNL